MRPTRRPLTVIAALMLWAPALPSPPSSSAQVIQPRLTADGKALILLEEIREPPDQRQPLVTLEVQTELGSRYIRVAGSRITPPRTVDLRCSSKAWTLTQSEARQVRDQVHAFFSVEEEVAAGVLASPSCWLVVAGVPIPIPPDLARAVWTAKPSPPSRGPGGGS